MCGPINILEIIRDYFKNIKDDLNGFLLVNILIALPLVIAGLFYFSLSDVEKFYNSLIIIASILIPLLLNLLMIVYYSLERTNKNENTKIEFLEHINSTISMTTLVAIFVLFASMILTNTKYTNKVIELIVFYFVGFLIINVLITLVRVYRLIRHEIKTKRESK